MSLRLVTPPSAEPVSLVEAKAHLRLEETVDDTYVATLIAVARQHIEKICWRGLLSQVLELTLPSFRGADKFELMPVYGFGGGDGLISGGIAGAYRGLIPFQSHRFQPFIELPRGHLAAAPAIAITYLDEAGALQTLSPTRYVIQGQGSDEMCGRVWLNVNGGYSWPNTLDRFDAVKITYTVGWAAAADVPAAIKQATLLLISQLYEYRTPEAPGRYTAVMEFSVDALLGPHRFVRL